MHQSLGFTGLCAKRTSAALTGLCVALLSALPIACQIIEFRDAGGKAVTCMHSGLFSDLNDCGIPDWYKYVFIGSIAAIAPAKDNEEQLQIVPEEVFGGEPANPLTVITSQYLCWPKMKVGDRWLFYLRQETGKPIVLDYYGNDSKPVENAEKEISTLRNLEGIGDYGILRGRVRQGDFSNSTPQPGATVIANNEQRNLKFTASTDDDGRFEFPPLPSGKYTLKTTTMSGDPPDDSSVEVKAGGCWDLSLTRPPRAHLSGQIRRANGKPVPNVDVVLSDSKNTWYVTTQTDVNGRFEFDDKTPGQYIIGINYPPRANWFNGSGGGEGIKIPPASIFYSDAFDRANAQVIELKKDQKIDNLDFVISEN
jgi:Carboxypeptidase regulatory-like domain